MIVRQMERLRVRNKLLFLIFALCIFLLHIGQCLSQNHKPRYISLAPSTTEILFALGLDDEIQGVSSYCDYPEKAKSKERIGAFSQINIEKIISLKPDYIFCTGLEQAPIIAQLKSLKLNYYVADPANTEELFNSIRDIGKITQREKEAEGLIKNIEGTIEEISSKVRLIPQEERKKVFIEIWDNPLTTAGKGSFIDELIALSGGINIAHDVNRSYSIFSAEEVIKRNPDCIILAYMDPKKPLDLLKLRLGWSQIKAVENNCIYNDINPDLILRPGPRIALGVKEIYKRLYH